MSIALPLIGVLLAGLVVYFSSREPVEGSKSGPRDWVPLAAAGVLLAILIGIATRYAPELDRPWLAAGAVLGIVAAIPFGTTRASACVGLAAAICAHLVPSQGVPAAQMALLSSVGLAVILTGSYAAAIGATAVLALDRFGSLADGSENLQFAGSLIALVLLFAAVSGFVPKKEASVGFAFGLPLLGFVILGSWLQSVPLAWTGALGVVTAVVLAVLLPEKEIAKPISVGVGALISIGLATAAFALGKGTGMAAALLGAVGPLLLLGYSRAILALGPLFALVLFRLFQNLYPETSRAFDIGQYYALIGLMIGAILPLIILDTGLVAEQLKRRGALLLLAVIAIVLVPLLTVFLGPTGAVGFLVGIGFAGLFELVRQGSSLLALSAGSGMAGVMLVSYGWLSHSLDLPRDEKIRLLAWSVVGILVLAGIAVLLLRDQPLKDKE